MSHRNWMFRLDDIIDALNAICEYMENIGYDDWIQDRKTIDAVIRNLEVIGEAAANIPEEIQKQHPDIPWQQMKGMRNVLIHEYFGVDKDVLWQTVQEDLPPLKRKIEQMLLFY